MARARKNEMDLKKRREKPCGQRGGGGDLSRSSKTEFQIFFSFAHGHSKLPIMYFQ